MDSLLPKFAPFLAAAGATEINSDPTLGGRLVNLAVCLQVFYVAYFHVINVK